MSCFACSKTYGFFTKEVGCPNCGFSFCTKCLKKNIEVPRCNNEKRNVCLSCYEKILKQKNAQTSNQSQSPSSAKSFASVLDEPIPNEEILPDIDEEIKKRLEVVKQPTNDLDKDFSDRGIAERLANLKGMPHKEFDNRAMLNAVDKRTETEMANDLVDRFVKEVSLDEAAKDDFEDPIKSIERRLAALKGSPVESSSKPLGMGELDDKPHDEEALVNKIVTKYLDEAALPDSDLTPEEKEFVNSVKPGKDQEELPWCVICNEDAIIRCVGCDGDLFCKSCFKEIHAHDEEYREHQTKAYTPPKESQPQ